MKVLYEDQVKQTERLLTYQKQFVQTYFAAKPVAMHRKQSSEEDEIGGFGDLFG